MSFDLDRYYTPENVARRALENAVLARVPMTCADSTCGTGRLLSAANDVFGQVRCVGIDRDRDAIDALRRRNPSWILAVGDLLSAESFSGTLSRVVPDVVDLLVLNPPFSHGGRKSVEIIYEGRRIKGSVAMAHLMRSFELFRPAQGAVVIVPESLLYSETDSAAREVICEKYRLRKVADLESCTFRGARAHASIVQIAPFSQDVTPANCRSEGNEVRVRITRGGLPVHLMSPGCRGVPYVHSSDIRKVVGGFDASSFLQTTDVRKGRVSGWSILFPRVGVPEESLVRAVKINGPYQLSDCVIALECSNRKIALQVEKRIRASWSEFRELYRGTGARYVTLSRLRAWLTTKNVFEVLPTTPPEE